MDVKDRHMSILITCLVFIFVGAGFAVLVKSGYQRQRRVQEQKENLEQLAQQLDAQRHSLEKEAEGLQNDPVFIEREARRLLGYIREDEKPIEKNPEPPVGPSPKAEAPPYQQAPSSMLQQVRGLVGMGKMAIAVMVVILVALGVGLGFGGRWRPPGPEPPGSGPPFLPPGGVTDDKR